VIWAEFVLEMFQIFRELFFGRKTLPTPPPPLAPGLALSGDKAPASVFSDAYSENSGDVERL